MPAPLRTQPTLTGSAARLSSGKRRWYVVTRYPNSDRGWEVYPKSWTRSDYATKCYDRAKVILGQQARVVNATSEADALAQVQVQGQ